MSSLFALPAEIAATLLGLVWETAPPSVPLRGRGEVYHVIRHQLVHYAPLVGAWLAFETQTLLQERKVCAIGALASRLGYT